MNCFKHPDVAAVSACQECNLGMCQDCVKNKVEMANGRTLCNSCAFKNISLYVQALKTEADDLESRRKMATLSLVVGVLCWFLLIAVNNPLFLIGMFAAFAFGSAKMNRKQEKSAEQKSLESLNRTVWLQSRHADSIILGNIIGWMIGTLLYPIFWLVFSVRSRKSIKEAKKEIEQQTAILENLQAA